MPKYKLKDGKLVDESGAVINIGDEPIEVEGAIAQTELDRVIKERLARATERIKALEASANETPELKKLLDAEKAEKSNLESQLSKAKEDAQAEVQAQLAKLTRTAEENRAAFENERKARIQDQVKVSILGAASDRFLNAAEDLVPRLLATHVREPKKGDGGKDIPGEFVDLFKMRYKDESGKEIEAYMPIDKAIDVFSANPSNRHYLNANATGGSGGGHYKSTDTNNPWADATWNVTGQNAILAQDKAKAKQLCLAAGKPLPASLQ